MNVLVLENELIKATILPEFGGKISSLIYKINNFDVVAPNTREVYKESNVNTSFSDRDASGLDDAFPTINAEELIINSKIYKYTDHGEIWRSRFETVKQTNDSVVLQYDSKENNYSYIKTAAIKNNSLILNYEIINHNLESYPCMWTFHGLMKYEEDMKIFYPIDSIQFLNALNNDKLLGADGNLFNIDNSVYDFSRVLDKNSLDMKKYYVVGKVCEGKCGFIYPSQNTICTLNYDSFKLPYLGVWITSGGYRGDYNCALEPSTGYYDSISNCIKNNALLYIKPNESFQFPIEIVLTCNN